VGASRELSNGLIRATDLVELSFYEAADGATEFREGIVRLIGGNRDRPSVPPRKAVIAGRDERSIRVNDFSGPTGPVRLIYSVRPFAKCGKLASSGDEANSV
jgi:hypothetical protein